MLTFLIGLIIGSFIGMALTCCAVVSGKDK